jgi:hypothetical protein
MNADITYAEVVALRFELAKKIDELTKLDRALPSCKHDFNESGKSPVAAPKVLAAFARATKMIEVMNELTDEDIDAINDRRHKFGLKLWRDR